MAVGVAFGVAFGVALDVAGGMARSIAFGVAFGVAFSVAVGMAEGMAVGVAFGIAGALGVAFGVAFGVAVLRPEDWVLGLLSLRLGRVTPLPLPGLHRRLRAWLTADWEVGLHNADQLLRYSLQFIPVVNAVNDALTALPPERLLPALSRLAAEPYDWNLVHYASASLTNGLKRYAVASIFFIPKKWRRRWQQRYSITPRLDTPARAAAGGFWYLHEKQPAQAAEAFAVVSNLPHGEGLYRLAFALAQTQQAADVDALAALGENTEFLRLSAPPREEKDLLHPQTWEALAHLRRASQEALAVQRSVSRAMRSQSLNRALGELVAIHEMKDKIPLAEQDLVAEIAAAWEKALLAVAGEVGQAAVMKPVRNPYIVGDPVIGSHFVGREDLMRRLEELWRGASALPSVALYGHRRMGKTSILRNLNAHLGAGIHLAYVNLLLLGEAPNGASDLLLAIADAVQAPCKKTATPRPPRTPPRLKPIPTAPSSVFFTRHGTRWEMTPS